MLVNSSELRAADFPLAEVRTLHLDAVDRGDRRAHGAAVRNLQGVGKSTLGRGLQGVLGNSWFLVWSSFTSGTVSSRTSLNVTYADDDNIIGRFSQALKFTAECNPVFKSDGNLDFNMGKTMVLVKGEVFCFDINFQTFQRYANATVHNNVLFRNRSSIASKNP
jgi:hypothetical protein